MKAGVFLKNSSVMQDYYLVTKNGDDFEFPMVDVEEGENPLFAAIRGCFQKTGYVVFVYPPSVFTSDDGNVKIYRAETACVSSGYEKHFVSADDITSKLGKEVLKHFEG